MHPHKTETRQRRKKVLA